MTDKGIAERAERFFEKGPLDREDVRLYLSRLLDRMGAVRRRINRTIVLSAGLMVLFLLLSSGDLTEAEVFGVKVQKFTIFLLLIPVLLAYLQVQAITSARTWGVLKLVYFKVTEQYYPAWRNSRFDVILIGTDDEIGGGLSEDWFKPGAGRWTVLLFSYVEAALVILVPIGFSLYAYARLFNERATVSLGWTATSALATVILTVLAFANVSSRIAR